MAVGLFSFFISVKAQNSTNDFVNLQPQIYIKDLLLDKAIYKAGDTVTGSFTAMNGRNFGSQNLTYKVFLVGDYNPNGGLYAYEWDNQQFGPVSFDKNEWKTIKFSYKLPLSSEGYSQGKQLGIKVWFFASNAAPLGWSDTFITISGSSVPSLKLVDAKVNVDGKDFGLQDGPMLYPDKTASLDLTLTNPSSEDISVAPNLTIYNMQSTQVPVLITKGDNVTLKTNGAESIKINLPSFSGKPGVYIGEAVLKDQNEVARTPVIRFRYIVYGDIVNVSSVIADKTSFNYGDKVSLKMIYTGSPIDITTIGTNTISAPSMADLSVKMFNENDQLVGEYDSNVDTTDVKTQLFTITASSSAKAIYTIATFTKDGKQIGYYKSELSSDFSKVKAQSEKQKMINTILLIVLSVFLIAIILFVIIKFKKKNNVVIPTALFILFTLLSLPVMTFAAVPANVTSPVYTAGNGKVIVKFTASNSVPAPTYIVTSNPAGGTDNASGTATTTHIITGLTNGTSYKFIIKTTNSNGSSTLSPSTTIIPYTVPNAPTNVTATAVSGSATVTFTAPTNTYPSNGGNSITGYTVTSNPGGISTNGSVSPIVINGLTNGTTYTFTVTANNGAGSSTPSAPSNSVTPAGTPSAPTNVVATMLSNGDASVSFTTSSDGGSPITSYTVTSAGAGVLTATGQTSPIIVTGFKTAGKYTFTVKATNFIGTSAASAASTAITLAATKPGIPKIGVASILSNGDVSVSYTASTSDGGSPVNYFTATSGGVSASSTNGPIIFSGFKTVGTSTFTVTATNDFGTSNSSAASNQIALYKPGVPTNVVPTLLNNGDISVSFNAPTSNGGSPIKSYTATAYIGTTAKYTATGINNPIVFSNINTPGTYTFKVAATNNLGTGSLSSVSTSSILVGVPGQPTNVFATITGESKVSVSFTSPTSQGGSPITLYKVTAYSGTTAKNTATGASSPIVISNFTAGGAYTFKVSAINNLGTGTQSSSSNSITLPTFSVPGKPSMLSAELTNDGEVTVTFASTTDGNTPITSYKVTAYIGTTAKFSVVGSSSPIVMTGFTVAGTYKFAVVAINAVGSSPVSDSSVGVVLSISKPGAPTKVTAVGGDRQATVSFTPPLSDGLSPITLYTVTSSGGQVTTGANSPITVTGLHNGYSYTFTVTATNLLGTGTASKPSTSVTPIYTFVQNGWTIIGAGNYRDDGWQGGGVPNITLNSPLPAGMKYYNAGDTVFIQGSSYMPACGNNSGKDLTIWVRPLKLASSEPNLISNSISLGTVDSFHYATYLVHNYLGGYYNATTNTTNFRSVFDIANNNNTFGYATCNGVSSAMEICVINVFSGNYIIPSGTPNGVYRLYILGQNDIGRVGASSDGTDPAAGNSQVLGYQDIQVGAPTCTDGIQNGSETGIDCGGSCPNSCNPNLGNISGTTANTSSLNCTNGTGNPDSIDLSWNTFAGADHYDVSCAGAQTDCTGDTATTSSITMSGLSPNTRYTYNIQAFDADGNALTKISEPVSAVSSGDCNISYNGTSTCSSIQSNNPLAPAQILINKIMSWTFDFDAKNINPSTVNWTVNGTDLSNNMTSNSRVFSHIYTSVGQKNFTARISGKTLDNIPFKYDCNASTTVIIGNGGYQEI